LNWTGKGFKDGVTGRNGAMSEGKKVYAKGTRPVVDRRQTPGVKPRWI